MNKQRIYNCLRGLIFCLLLETAFSLKAQAIDYTISHSAKDLILYTDKLIPDEGTLIVDGISSSSRETTAAAVQPSALPLDLDSKIINNSPSLQRWIEEVPNIASDITNDPSFRTRIRVQYLNVRSSNHASNFKVSIEDLRLSHTRATINTDFQISASSNYQTWGASLHYHLYPLGSYINVVPVIGYRNLKFNTYSTSGVDLGLRLLFVLSRGGGADVSLTQTWVAPGSNEEAGLSTLSFGYALNRRVRLSTELQYQNTKRGTDNRVGIGVEWML